MQSRNVRSTVSTNQSAQRPVNHARSVFVMVALDRVYRDTPYFCTTHAEHFTLVESRNELCSANQLPVLISLYLRLWIGGVCGKAKGAGNQRR